MVSSKREMQINLDSMPYECPNLPLHITHYKYEMLNINNS